MSNLQRLLHTTRQLASSGFFAKLLSTLGFGRFFLSITIWLKHFQLFFGVGHPDSRVVEYPWVLNRLPKEGRLKVLDVGCTSSLLSHELIARGYRVVGIDIREHMWKNHRMQFCKVDLRRTQMPSELFDVIIAVSTIEHIGLNVYDQYQNAAKLFVEENGDIEAMRELYRILKGDGLLFLTTPFMGKGPFRILGWDRRYDETSLKRLVEDFDIIEEGYFVCGHSPSCLRRFSFVEVPKERVHQLKFDELFPGVTCLVLRKKNIC